MTDALRLLYDAERARLLGLSTQNNGDYLNQPRWSGLAVSASLSVGSLKVLDGEWESALKDPLGKHNNPL